MSATIDERIVAAKFDASDFEKGVDKTLKKLDELKKSLDMKDATKSVTELAEKTQVSTDSMNKSLEKLTDRFTSFVGMIKQKILSGLADEVANVFLRMEQSVTGFIKSISSAQVGVGMSKYEEMLKAVRIMMSNGETESDAYKAIDDLRSYSDQTSYSLSQMTDALSKIKAAGTDLDVATRSVEGIANACADAGINAYDAQRAFYNLSQAYSSGTLKYTDYRSLELLNMTTAKFKDQLLEAAVQAKTLKKVSEDTYQTINSSNKKVTAGKKVTRQNLQDMLRYNFVTSDVLNELFGGKFFFDEKKYKEYKSKYKSLEEAVTAAKKDYGETAVNAYLAAREARSFTDVLNTIKDVVSTGWSTTFEHLFGKLEKAKDFFTELAESGIAEVIYKINDYRNAILGFWDAGLDGTGGGEVFRQTILNISDAIGTLIETFLQVLPGFDEVWEETEDRQPTLKKLGEKMFFLSMRIREVSKDIKKAAEDFNTFMNGRIMKDGPTRIEIIRNIFANLSSILGIVGKLALIALNGISKAFYTLSPIMDGILQVFEKITKPLVSLKNNKKVFDDIEHSINNLFDTLKPVAEILGTIIGFLSNVAGFFAQMAIDTVTTNISFFADAFGLIIELFGGESSQQKLNKGEGIIANIQKDFEGIKNACKDGLNALNEFFGALIGDLRRLLGLTDGEENQNGGIFSGIISFFETNEFVKNAKAWIDQAISDVSAFILDIPNKIRKLGSNIYETLFNAFFTVKGEYIDGHLQSKYVLTPLGEWLDQAIKDVKEFFVSLPDKIIKGVGNVLNWVDQIFNYYFGERAEANDGSRGYTVMVNNGNGWEKAESLKLQSRFDEFIWTISVAIREWFNDLPNKIEKALSSIGSFAAKLYDALDTFLFGRKIQRVEFLGDKNGKKYVKVSTQRIKSGFSKWLDGIILEVKKIITNIPEYIKSAIRGAGDLISTVIKAIFGIDNNKTEATSKDIEEKLERPFLGINLSNIINKIKEIGQELLNQIARIFTGSDNIEQNQEWFSNKIAEGIEWIRTKAKIALDVVLDFIKNLPTKIANLFKDEDSSNQDKGPVGNAISNFGKTIGGFITSIPTTLVDFFTNAINGIDGLWTDFYKALTNENTEAVTQVFDDNSAIGQLMKDRAHQKSKWDEFVESFGKLISTAFEKLPTWVAEGIHAAVVKVQELFNQLTDWLSGENAAAEMEKAAEEARELAEKGAAKTAEEVSKGAVEETTNAVEKSGENAENPLLNAVKGIGQSLYNLITTTVPTFLKEGWTWVVRKGGEVWNAITGLFNGINTNDFSDTVSNIGESIKNAILGLPQTIANAFHAVSEAVKKLFKKESPLDLSGLSDADKAYVSRYVDKMKKDSKIGNEEQKSLLSVFSEIFDSIFGENGLLSSDIGQKISNFFLVTVPEFIGKAFGEMINAIPRIYESFSKGVISTAKAEGKDTEKKAEEPVEAVTRISNVFANILESFMHGLESGYIGTVATTIVQLIAIIEVLKVVQSILNTINVTGNMAERAEAKNGFLATMKRITTAIIAAFALVAYVASLPDDKRKDALQAIKDLTNMFTLLVELTVAGSAVNKGLDTISTLSDNMAAMKNPYAAMNRLANNSTKKNVLADGLSKSITGLTTVAGSVAAGEMIQYGLEDIISSIVSVFERVADGLKTASDYISSTIKTVADLKDNVKIAIEVAADIIDFVKNLSGMAEYSDQVNTIVEKMPGLTGAIELFKNSVSGRWIRAKEITESLKELTSMTYEMRVFANFAQQEEFEDFKYALASLGAALSMYSLEGITSLDKTSGISSAVEILQEILGNKEIMSLAEQLNTSEMPDASNIFKTSEKLVILAGAIASISKAANDIPSNASVNLQNLFDAVSGLSIPEGGNEVSGIAQKFGTLGNALSTFANDTSGLTQDKLDSVKIAIDIMTDLTKSLKGTGQSFIEKVFEGDEGLDEFGSKLSIFGNKLKNFFQQIDGEDVHYNPDNINVALIALRTIAVAYRDLNEKELLFKTDWTHLGTGLSGFGTTLGSFLNTIKTIDMSNEQLTKVRKMLDMVHVLAEVAVMGFGNNANTELGELANQINPNNANGIGTAMTNFFNSLNGLEVNDNSVHIFESFGKVMSALGEISKTGLSARSGGIAYGKSLFDDLSAAFSAFNTNFDDMKAFFVNVKEFDADGVSIATDLFGSLKDFGEALSYFADANVDRGLNNLKWFDWSNLAEILNSNLFSAFAASENQTEYSSIARSLHDGIQEAFNSDPELKLKIAPVIDFNSEEMKQQLAEGLGIGTTIDWPSMVEAIRGANNQTDEERVKASELYPKIAEVVTAIKAGPDNVATIGDVTKAFAGMKIVTDTKALIAELTPGIDEEIGNRIWLIQQGITP